MDLAMIFRFYLIFLKIVMLMKSFLNKDEMLLLNLLSVFSLSTYFSQIYVCTQMDQKKTQ